MSEQEEKINIFSRFSKDKKYGRAVKLMESKKLKDLNLALKLFREIPGWHDADIMAENCEIIIEEIEKTNIYNDAKKLAKNGSVKNLQKAVFKLEAIRGWKDSDVLIEEYYNRIAFKNRPLEKLKRGAVKLIIAGTIAFSMYFGVNILFSAAGQPIETVQKTVQETVQETPKPTPSVKHAPIGAFAPFSYYDLKTKTFMTGEGFFMDDTGLVYTGGLADGLADDQKEAQLIIPGTGQYNGSFAKGKKEGKGSFVWENGDQYIGSWKDDKMDGEGVLTITDGTKYTGTFSEGMLSGEFVVEYANQDSYAGSFIENKRAGTGTYTWAANDVYIGEWSDDLMNGKGNLTFSDGTVFKGTFKDNVLEGEAVIVYSNEDSYEGNISSSKKAGEGKYVWKNGAFYSGKWKNDKMEGEGTYYYTSDKNGKRLTGTFKNNVPDGSLVYNDGNGHEYDTEWEKGKCIKAEVK